MGWLHTSGTRTVDAAGTTVALTGLNVTGMESSNPQGSDVPGVCKAGWKELTPDEVAQIASYGFHSVRVTVAWANLEPTAPTVAADGTLVHQWNTTYLDALDREVGLFATHGISVVLNMFQASWSNAFAAPATSKRPGCPGTGMPAWLDPSAATETANQARCRFLAGTPAPGVPGTPWADFSAASSYLFGHYAGDPTVVGADVLNEPYCASGDLDRFYAQVAPVIGAANPHVLIILEDRETPSGHELSALPAVPNVVYSIHLHQDYWSTPGLGQAGLPYTGQAVMEANTARSQQWNVPLYVGEFYAFDAAGVQNGKNHPDGNWVADTRSFLSFSRADDVGWAYWAWIAQKKYTNQVSIPGALRTELERL